MHAYALRFVFAHRTYDYNTMGLKKMKALAAIVISFVLLSAVAATEGRPNRLIRVCTCSILADHDS